MTEDQLEILRSDIGFYASTICSVASHDAVMSAVWLALALVIVIHSKFKQRDAAGDASLSKEKT